LRNSFRPPEEIRRLRTMWRLRDRHVAEAAREIQHMQKALTTMNVQLANVISDISGVTGMAILRAILQGERDPYRLAQLRNYRIQASEEEIARSLEGNWRDDVLFELRQALESYDFVHKQVADCDVQLQQYLAALPDRDTLQPADLASGQDKAHQNSKKTKSKGRKSQRNQPKFNLEAEFTRICGVNLKTIDGVDVITIATFVSELGTDMTPWRTEDHLVSWLKLAPCRQISGGKVIRHQNVKTKNRVADALRMAASSLIHSDSYLGARFRHLRSRLGPGKAIKATAAHLARLIYRMLMHGQDWVDRGAQEHETKRTEREKLALQRKAAALGFRLEPAA